MKRKSNKIDRRDFLKTVGAAGLGSVLGSAITKAGTAEPNAPAKAQEPKLPQVPRRKLGRTGVEVPCLSLGSGAAEDPTVLRKALEWGVSYWDTSYVSGGGNSELGIGRYLSKNPQVREKLFIVTKESRSKTAADVEKCLQVSLERMNTRYVDLYFGVYMMSDPVQLTDELKQWVESAKRRKLIRFFGFSTHKNMADCLQAAARLDWIDAIMVKYDFRLMQDEQMAAAVEACHKAGIGLVAMKTQARGQEFETEKDKELAGHFLGRGFTAGQAKIKVVLEDKRISSACVKMNNVALLTSNVAAVLDKTRLTQADVEVFKAYARATCRGYCAGCAHICDSVLPDTPYVSDIMRYLMYHNSYGDKQRARQLFAEIPGSVRKKLLSTDYSPAEAVCPQHIPIGEAIAEAVKKLA